MAEATSPQENETHTHRPMATDTYTLSSFVDEVESRVDILRRQANALMGERASLLMIMDQLKNDCMNCDISPEDCQELVTNMERLKARCEAVEIQVHTVRDEGQLLALHKVNDALKELQTCLTPKHDVSVTALQQARFYLNACLPEPVGPIDSRFQSMVLGCAVDDQKDVRRRLKSLIHECSSERKAEPSQPDNSKDVSNTDLSNNSTRLLDAESTSAQSAPASNSPLPSDVTSDPVENEVANHLTAQWYTLPTDLSHENEQQPAQSEKGETNQSHAKKNSGACNKEENASPFHSSS